MNWRHIFEMQLIRVQLIRCSAALFTLRREPKAATVLGSMTSLEPADSE
jgi:hypothetical protein